MLVRMEYYMYAGDVDRTKGHDNVLPYRDCGKILDFP